MKVVFSPTIIAELRHRAVDHNKAMGNGKGLMKIGQLKSLYKRYYAPAVADPHVHALQKIDDHLLRLRDKVALKKAQRPFDEGRHPRDRRGEFASGGGSGAPPGRGGDGGDGGHDDGRRDDDALLEAARTQVIPETRYSVIGPRAAYLGGVGLGAIAGAGARFPNRAPLTDRLATSALGAMGTGAGRHVVGPVAGAAVRGAHAIARRGIRAANAAYGSHIPEPSSATTDAAVTRIKGAAERGGKAAGRLVGHTAQLYATGVPAAGRWAVEHFGGGRIKSIAAGALLGAAVPGALIYGPSGHRLMTNIGPYLDSLYPRRVRKQEGWDHLIDDPDVLAKQMELLNQPLAKANITRLAAELIRSGGQLIGHARPSVASHVIGHEATGIGPEAAEATFRFRNAGEHGFEVRRGRAARIANIAAIGGATSTVGAGVGAIGGAAGAYGRLKWDESRHPRGQHGRFVRGHAILGAKLGAAVGAGLGVAAGIAAMRRGNTRLLAQAIERLGGAHEEMRTATEARARNVHASRFFDENKGKQPLRTLELPPGTSPSHEQVRAHIENEASKKWHAVEGHLINAGPEAFHTNEVEQEFDRQVRSKFYDLRDKDGERLKLPYLDGLKRSPKNGANFINNVDREELTEGQRKIWDDLVAKRQKGLDDIKQIYDARRDQAQGLEELSAGQAQEIAHLRRQVQAVPARIDQMESEGTNLNEVRRYAKENLDYDLPTGLRGPAGREEAFKLLDERVSAWRTETTARINQLQPDIARNTEFAQIARTDIRTDLKPAEYRAIMNPFQTQRGKGTFLKEIPNYDEANQAVRAAASKSFVAESDAVAQQAREHLDHLAAAHVASLRMRMPHYGLTPEERAKHFPTLAAWLANTHQDSTRLQNAYYEGAGPTMKKIMDWALAQRDRKVAWQSIKDIAGWAKDQSKNAMGTAIAHRRAIASIGALAGAVGLLDTPKGSRLKAHKPEGLALVRERPNPIDKPDDMLMGVSYHDRKTNRRKLLYGMYFQGANHQHTLLPGDDLLDVLQRVRAGRPIGGGGGGGGDHDQNLRPINVSGIEQTIGNLKNQGHIHETPVSGGRPFSERTGGGNDADQKERAAADDFWNEHIKFLASRPNLNGKSSNNAHHYWRSLRELFSAKGTEIFRRRTRVNLLVGDGQRRGLFANRGGVFTSDPNAANKRNVQAELIRQVNQEGAKPRDNGDFHALWKALSIVGEHYHLNADEMRPVRQALDRTNSQREGGQQQGQHQQGQQRQNRQERPQASRQRAEDRFHDAFEDIVVRPEHVENVSIREGFHKAWLDTIAQQRRAHPGISDDEAAAYAKARLAAGYDRYLESPDETENDIFERSEPVDSLRKYLRTWDGKYPDGPTGAPKLQTPKIAGAAAGLGPPKVPAITGASEGPAPLTTGQYLHAETRPRQIATQTGAYGLGGALADAAELLPGGRAVRLAAATAGGIGGMLAGQKVGNAINPGRRRDQSLGEMASRGISGYGGYTAGKAIVGRAIRNAHLASRVGQATGTDVAESVGGRIANSGVNRAVGGAIQGAGERIGGSVGRWLGAIGGEAADPAGGGIAGAAIGTAAGAGLGYLADEGIGLLYHHLSRYGSHTADMAAKTLGASPKQRQNAAARVGSVQA